MRNRSEGGTSDTLGAFRTERLQGKRLPALSLPRILPRIQDPDLEFGKYVNLLGALAARRRNAETVHSRPFELTIDPATLCQLECPYCAVGNKTMTRTRALLKEPLHRRILAELGRDTFIAWYFSAGEPVLNKELGAIMRETQGLEIFSTISTNLSLPLSDERIDDLLTCGLGCISVSLDGASADTYSFYRRGGDFDLVVHNLQRLVDRKRELGLRFPLLEWRFLVFGHNHHETARIPEIARAMGVDLFEIFPGYAPQQAAEGEVTAAPPGFAIREPNGGPAWDAAHKRRDSTLHRLLGSSPDPGAPPIPEALASRKCDWLYFGSMLFPNGSISPCCVSNEEADDFGSLSDGAGFADNWNNTTFREARGLFLGKDPRETQDLVCGRRPLPSAQDYQFITSLRALIRNAPDWVVQALRSEPDRFFHEIDNVLMPMELAALRRPRLDLDDDFSEVSERLARRKQSDAGSEDLAWLQALFAREPASRRSPSLIARLKRAAAGFSAPQPDPMRKSGKPLPDAIQAMVDALDWRENPMPPDAAAPLKLHLGCGDQRFSDFVNIDFLPEQSDVLAWNLLDLWPPALADRVGLAFCEDLMEHFFFEEQVYLLAQMNIALQEGGLFRVLMPNLRSLLGLTTGYDPASDFLSTTFGAWTGADAVNLGMRFGGHRWLHDEESFAKLARLCGFAPTLTPCAESKSPDLCGLNLRDETNSMSFAHDLEKESALESWTVQPSRVEGAYETTRLRPATALYRSYSKESIVHYELPRPVDRDDVVLISIRGANLTQIREHNHSKVVISGGETAIDRTLSSSSNTSMVAAPLIRARIPAGRISSLCFHPSRHKGDYFSVGPLEVFLRP